MIIERQKTITVEVEKPPEPPRVKTATAPRWQPPPEPLAKCFGKWTGTLDDTGYFNL